MGTCSSPKHNTRPIFGVVKRTSLAIKAQTPRRRKIPELTTSPTKPRRHPFEFHRDSGRVLLLMKPIAPALLQTRLILYFFLTLLLNRPGFGTFKSPYKTCVFEAAVVTRARILAGILNQSRPQIDTAFPHRLPLSVTKGSNALPW